ncbi:GNAT family N-acetyltransferase [Thalassolituus sp.]|jgi:putative hemolysin|uniref:GNAT family N-acetyltransferase n=1 Tax=Thalassolituus sp. TaxID=2030822 RepID=UPI002A7F499E|nr:GNAT family N-acyltransferase [Thalassolituus sp.]
MQQAIAPLRTEIAEASLIARITDDPQEIQQALELRFRVFAEDMGADVEGAHLGIDKDRFDDLCMHLVIKDVNNDRVVGYSRILTNELAKKAGGFYSSTEFDLSNIVRDGRTFMEIGRTCVDPDFRSGSAIGMLWAFIAQYLDDQNIDYLMGCCSIPLSDGYARAVAVVNHLREHHYTSPDLRVTPKVRMPTIDVDMDGKHLVPSLLRAYLRLGVKVCGEPYLDKDFNVADALILLHRTELDHRYLRRILKG